MQFVKSLLSRGFGVPIVVIMMLAMMILPLPPFLLDILFTFNIALSLTILLTGIYTTRPLDFAVFPTVLLLATLLRLGLNIASTRVVLLEGHTGTDAAGQVIQAFGDFVVGGNYAVGLVVFAILVIINFVVVTKGAGRISEVSARFTLDAMPGKQMAIDADLNAGLIDQEEAKQRRADVVNESDFYGSMDGASKFVRGDAVAGILILFINIIGGLAIGMLQHDMTFNAAATNYSLLTIGDGLVAQIPSLILSTAAAIMVTRTSTEDEVTGQIYKQLFGKPRVLVVTASVIGIMGLIPGMPNFAFLSLAAVIGGMAYLIAQKEKQAAIQLPAESEPSEPPPEQRELSWDDVVPVDTIGLEVGYRLIPLVDKNQGGQMMTRIKGIRKKLTQELGFLIPSVHIRDNLDLAPTAYRISLFGVAVGESEVFPDKEMAINPGQVYGQLQGAPAKDPAFGLDAVWIDPSLHDQAQSLGYTVVDASTVVATHISHLLQTHAHELLGREEVQHLLDSLSRVAPKLVEGLVPDTLPLGVVQRVLQSLLEEQIPIRDMRTIAETLSATAPQSQDPAVLTTVVRSALGRLITQKVFGNNPEVQVMTLNPELEQLLQQSMQTSGEAGLSLEPGLAEKLHKSLADSAQRQELSGQPAVLLTSAPLRSLLAKFVRHTIPGLFVLSYNEVPNDKQVKIVASVGR